MCQEFKTIPATTEVCIPRKIGIAALVLGTVTISDSEITSNTMIFLTAQNGGILAGIVRVSEKVVGVSFTILSTNLADTANIAYLLFEP